MHTWPHSDVNPDMPTTFCTSTGKGGVMLR
jgi:hypothetical protein